MSYAALSPDRHLKPPFKIKWKTRIAGTGGQNGVIVADGMMFAASYNGFVEALDAGTGEIRWRNPQPILPVPGGAPQGDGLVVHDGKVLIAWHEKDDGIEAAALDLATGKEIWRVHHDGLVPPAPADAKKVTVRVCQGATDGKNWFLSVCANRDGGEGRLVGGATLALDPADGKLHWKNTEKSVSGWGGLNCRNGIVVVHHTGRGFQALEAGTGKFLWQSASFSFGGAGAWHLAPLTDEFLATQGRRIVGGYCADAVWANDHVYGPPGSASHVLSARKANGSEGWRYVVISRGCPAPAPAYGRLYYAGFSEGVVYCFVNAE